jgi:hypothetical protein
VTVSVLDACDDEQLLGFDLWPGQRDLLQWFQLGQDAGDWLSVWCVGRRSGKSTLAALVALHSCLLRPDLDAMAGSTGGSHAIAIATNLKQARHLIGVAREIVQVSPLLSSMLNSDTLDSLTFSNGTVFAAFPASSRGGRGRAVRCLILDEAAHLLDNDGGSAAEVGDVFAAMIPATAQFRGKAPVIVCSTPAGDANFFADLVRKADTGELEHGRAFRAPSADMNPHLDKSFLEAEERRDPDSFRGEYLAELIGSGGAFLDPDLVESCVASRGELDPDEADSWVAGFDPSFSQDPAAVVMVGRSRVNPDRLLVGCVRSWLPLRQRKTVRTDERRQLEDRLLSEVADVCERFHVRAVVTDGYMPGVVNEALRRRGLWVEEFTLTTGSKVEMFAGVKARLAAGSIELYPEPTLVAELKRLRSVFRGGSRMIETPRLGGTHCDSAIALGLACQHIDRDGRPGTGMPLLVDVSPNGPIFGKTTSVFGSDIERGRPIDPMRRVF